MIETDQNVLATQHEYIVFCVDNDEYCIDIRAVREIRRWTHATRLPRTPNYVKGVVNLRGAVLPVIDFACRLGLGETQPTPRHSTIIVEAHNQLLGLLVDTVSDILTATNEHMQPTPAIAADQVHEIVSGLIIVEGRMLRIVNVGNISPHIEVEAA
ncbi:MAG: chemotaxis protein CheW [Pseudomonadota bacterium]